MKQNTKKSYGDEMIVKVLNAYKKGVQGDIYSGIYIQEDLYRFVRKDIYENDLSMYIPIRFNEIKGNEISNFSPEKCDVIYISTKGNVQISFVKAEDNIEINPKELFEDIISKMKMLNTSVRIQERGTENSETSEEIEWLNYKISYGNSIICVLLFMVYGKGKLFIGKCSCNMQVAQLWTPIFREMMKTLIII